MAKDPKPQPMPVIYEVTATFKYAVSVRAPAGQEEKAKTHALRLIQNRTGLHPDNILNIEVHQRMEKP